MDHIRDAHNVPREIRKVSLEMLFRVYRVPDVSTFRHFKRRTAVQRSWIIAGSSLSSAQEGPSARGFHGKYLEQLRALLLLNTVRSTTGGPSDAACSPVSSTADHPNVLCAAPRPSRRVISRRRPVRVMEPPVRLYPRLTVQDPLTAAGAVVFDCRPPLMLVSLDVTGIDMPTIRSSALSVEADVVPPEREQSFGGGGGEICLV